MNHTELVQSVGIQTRADGLRVDDDDINKIIKSTLGSIADSLGAGEQVKLRGFGTFYVQQRDSHQRPDFTGAMTWYPSVAIYRWRAAESLRR